MIISLLAGIIQNARNRRKEAEAQAQAQQALNEQQSRLNSFFQNNYYGDYLNRPEVQATLQNMQNQIRRQNEQMYGMNAIRGGTPESLAAMQNNNAAAMGNAYSSIAANGAGWKDRVLENYINNSMALNNQDYNLWAQKAADFRNAAQQTALWNLDTTRMYSQALLNMAGMGMGSL